MILIMAAMVHPEVEAVIRAPSPEAGLEAAERAWRALPPERQAELGAAAVAQGLAQLALADGYRPEKPLQQLHAAATITIEDVLRRHSLPAPSTARQARDRAHRKH
ncbi:MAG: hypothetical protein KAY22_04490 [Rhizorhabdus sp.]|uniref:hypothetical protein n=1 Tax=Rhizorhabdus sp. TaxID=1968843 RepID=UPI001B57A588|nr:hypothetical protein [Rhizorhabdus sp.]MBP8231543.1 hypothetical protein [Rhizorhabdus sp.]